MRGAWFSLNRGRPIGDPVVRSLSTARRVGFRHPQHPKGTLRVFKDFTRGVVRKADPLTPTLTRQSLNEIFLKITYRCFAAVFDILPCRIYD
jgi:hypothetical protein